MRGGGVDGGSAAGSGCGACKARCTKYTCIASARLNGIDDAGDCDGWCSNKHAKQNKIAKVMTAAVIRLLKSSLLTCFTNICVYGGIDPEWEPLCC